MICVNDYVTERDMVLWFLPSSLQRPSHILNVDLAIKALQNKKSSFASSLHSSLCRDCVLDTQISPPVDPDCALCFGLTKPLHLSFLLFPPML